MKKKISIKRALNEGYVWGTAGMTRRKLEMNRAGANNLLTNTDEIQELIRRVQEDNDIEARNEIIIRYQTLVTKMVNRRCAHNSAIKEDCANQCTFAIDDAIRRYDPKKGTLFAAIYGACYKELWEYTYGVESGQVVKPHSAQIGVNIEKCKRYYWQAEHRDPTIDEVEEYLWKTRKLKVPREELVDYAPTSMDTTYGDGDDSYTAGEVGEIARRTASEIEDFEDSPIEDDSIIRKAFRGLDDRERNIVIRMTGLTQRGVMTDDLKTLEAEHIADDLKMTKTRVLQIYNGAIKKLKATGLFKEPVNRYNNVEDDVEEIED